MEVPTHTFHRGVTQWAGRWSMKVGVAGDWHGASRWAVETLDLYADAGVTTVFHVGDFGIWPGEHGRRYLQAVTATLRENGQHLYATPGNHEDYDQIGAVPVTVRDEYGPIQWITERVALLPRGHRFTVGGRRAVSLGGAPSIDRERRIPRISWWPQEALTREQVDTVVAGGHADLMFTHDSPDIPLATRAVADIVTTPYLGASSATMEWVTQGRRLMTEAVLAVQPLLLFHGHYHVYDQALRLLPGTDDPMRIVSLAHDGTVGNAVILDTQTLDVQLLR